MKLATRKRGKYSTPEVAMCVVRCQLRTWGAIENAAGINDRAAFWREKDEAQARAACAAMISARIDAGELVVEARKAIDVMAYRDAMNAQIERDRRRK